VPLQSQFWQSHIRMAVLSAIRRIDGVAAGNAINRRTVSSQILCAATGSLIKRSASSGSDVDRSSGGTYSKTASKDYRVSFGGFVTSANALSQLTNPG
jgi:hypothetical protein